MWISDFAIRRPVITLVTMLAIVVQQWGEPSVLEPREVEVVPSDEPGGEQSDGADESGGASDGESEDGDGDDADGPDQD